MPAKSEKQRRFMGAELGRLRSGKKTETRMSEEQLGEFASKTQDAHGNEEPLVLSRIDAYLDKHDRKRMKCGHKRGDPNHLEFG